MNSDGFLTVSVSLTVGQSPERANPNSQSLPWVCAVGSGRQAVGMACGAPVCAPRYVARTGEPMSQRACGAKLAGVVGHEKSVFPDSQIFRFSDFEFFSFLQIFSEEFCVSSSDGFADETLRNFLHSANEVWWLTQLGCKSAKTGSSRFTFSRPKCGAPLCKTEFSSREVPACKSACTAEADFSPPVSHSRKGVRFSLEQISLSRERARTRKSAKLHDCENLLWRAPAELHSHRPTKNLAEFRRIRSFRFTPQKMNSV